MINNLHNYIAAPFEKGVENMKIAFQSKSENPDITLAERIGRFVLGILEMIPIINYAVCALDKHLVFKEKISVIVKDAKNENKLKESEMVTEQPAKPILTAVKKLSPQPGSPIRISQVPEEKVVSLPELVVSFSEPTEIPSKENTEHIIIQIEEEDKKSTLPQREIIEDEEYSLSEDILNTVNTKTFPDNLISKEIQIHEEDVLNLENDETIQQHTSDNDILTPNEQFFSDTQIEEDFEQENIPSDLEQLKSEDSVQDSEEEISFEREVRHNSKIGETDDSEESCLEGAWKVVQATATLALLFGVGYYAQKLYSSPLNPPIGPSTDINQVPPPVKQPAFDDPIYIPPVLHADHEKSKICLLTAYTSDNSERLEMSQKVAANQRDYSNLKGYDYLEYTNNLAVETDPVTGSTIKWEPYWSKIAAVNKILNSKESALEDKPEWIIWLDDDAVITNPDINMEDVIAHYTKGQQDLNFFVTTDSMSHILQGIPLNSAVLFIKNNDWSRKFFAKVWEMRKTRVPGESYTYGNCPHQSCLHEQQAITDLLKYEEFKSHARIIPQRDPFYPVGINTFVRENHIDLNRHNMFLNYDGDKASTRGQEGDFIQQCTGLATRAKKVDAQGNRELGVRNLRLECINKLLKLPEPKPWNEFFTGS